MAIPAMAWPVLLLAAGLSGGCTLKTTSLSQQPVDITLTTSSVRAAEPQDADLASDRLTIQNAVSSANIDNLAGADLSWKNTRTGSAGVVTSITETVTEQVTCRRFQTTRTSYSGIGIHEGEVCTGTDGMWWTRRFDEI